LKLIVDADATPRRVLEICKELAQDAGLDLITVASYNHNVISNQHITVGGDPEETDIKIANLTRTGDLVVTQDWGLAALLLGRGAAVISPGGHIYRLGTIDFLLEERNIKAKYRRAGGRTKGPAKRTAKDDQRFTAGLKQLLQSHP
jgi:uncharacterized protein YaiI (UPF0178 family)